MKIKELMLGFIAGIIVAIFGCFIFIMIFTDFDIIPGIIAMKSEGKLGKLISLGAILDLVLFSLCLKLNKDFVARGVILAVFVIAILTLFA